MSRSRLQPLGPSLPPPQREFEQRYRHELRENFGIEFDSLLTITNMPIKRFTHDLVREGELEECNSLLVRNFNEQNLRSLMYRSLISVNHEGRLFDCDFNQALGIVASGQERTIFDIGDLSTPEGRLVRTANHCFGFLLGISRRSSGPQTP
jgi:hypothetical protein